MGNGGRGDDIASPDILFADIGRALSLITFLVFYFVGKNNFLYLHRYMSGTSTKKYKPACRIDNPGLSDVPTCPGFFISMRYIYLNIELAKKAVEDNHCLEALAFNILIKKTYTSSMVNNATIRGCKDKFHKMKTVIVVTSSYKHQHHPCNVLPERAEFFKDRFRVIDLYEYNAGDMDYLKKRLMAQ